MSTETRPNTSGALIGAIAIAVLALLLGVFAVGTALSATNNSATIADPLAAEGDGAPTEVAVSLEEFSIAPAPITVAEGGRLLVTNDGTTVHNLKLKSGEAGTSDLNAGDEATLDLAEVPAGTYTVFCDIPGHEAGGMTAELRVTSSAAAPTSGGDSGGDMGHGSAGGDATALQAEMLEKMKASIGAFPAETEGVGAAVLEPTILDDGTKLFELVVDEVKWEVEPGKVVDALGYNGMVPGPTMFADIGDRVTIRVVNELDNGEGTSLHPHGLKDHAFELDGVTFISQDPIESGASMDYTFVADQESVVTYHSHHMSLHQVPNGLFGAMIIGDYAQLAGIDGVVDEQVMILNDAGNIGFSLNGKSFPATTPYQYTAGDKVVVHYANEGQMAHPMHLHNQTGTVIAKDGYLLPAGARYQGDTFNVAPGERLTVVYEMNTPGVWVWHCHILSHVKRADGSMFGMLTAVIIDEAPTSDTGSEEGTDA